MRYIGFILAFVFGATSVVAAPMTLKEAAQKAVSNSPDVLARFHTFSAAIGEQDAVRGGYFPNVTLSGGTSKERLKEEGSTTFRDFNAHGTSLILNQLLYDGFTTRSEVRRLGYAKVARYYEFIDASETAALEAARAYYDVLRYRRLLELAQDNYVSHRSVFEQIQQRVKAGVGRRVDLEQASGRLALAESNLLTEAANLHDVSARFQRVVGEAPPELAAPPVLDKALPGPLEALRQAQQRNASLAAAIENVRAAQSAVDARRGAYQPVVAMRLRQDLNHNLNGANGNRESQIAELTFNFNLFNGGTDSARVRQYTEQLNVAKDQRDKACRDVRQTVAIAANDTLKLKEQMRYLDQHQLSIEKAREAYQKQFDIGQRSLLDLLDTENELFQARRAYVNAEQDLATAFVRVHAGVGTLLTALDVSKRDTGELAELGQKPDDDAATMEACPSDVPAMVTIDKQKLTEQALARMKEAVAAAAAASAKAAPAIQPTQEELLKQRIQAWAAAWSAKNVESYAAFYAPTFAPEQGVTRAAWLEQRQRRLGKPGTISVVVENVTVNVRDEQHAVVSFHQIYTSADYQDVSEKTLSWIHVGDKWLIEREQSKP